MGASILMGNQFGAKDYDRLHRQISTTMLSGIAFSLILSVLCIVFARPILLLMQVDASIMGMTINYLRIIFAGRLFTFMYNCFASTLRALGDSQSPLYFLITSAVINILGDLFFEMCIRDSLQAVLNGLRVLPVSGNIRRRFSVILYSCCRPSSMRRNV